ncbi:MAG: Coenzyme F420 hydrogenase/dehydrogenase, beta subunit C-terminal domain [Muribaculaceae bacterium]|nr:Coenzyme F420 hydrogenase/dehydrogenase, beta subunit C-terminal domain [Muribaculaceae bacterium]
MITLTDSAQCCGCSACKSICGHHAITMEEDDKGFLYPRVNKDLCVDCGLCEKVCPFINQNSGRLPASVYAAKNIDVEIRKQSSSGGIFTVLAEYVINKGGVVFGAKFNEEWQVVHGLTEDLEGIKDFRGSKYVQSVVGETYSQARKFLLQGRLVLFTGTPCQILGLKNFLHKEYDNLLTLEVFCHGVPSPKIWREYLNDTISTISKAEKKSGSLPQDAKLAITAISHRDKRLGWKKFGIVVRGNVVEGEKESGASAVNSEKTFLQQEQYQNPYLKCFISNVYLRPSCHACKVKSGSSGADFALADFWGIDRHCHSFSDNYGVTLLYAVSEKASEIIDSMPIEKVELNNVEYLTLNRAYTKSAVKNKYSDLFWKKYQHEGISALYSVSEMLKPTLIQKIKTSIRNTIKKMILR